MKANYFNGKIDEAASTIEILDAFATKNATIVDEGNIRWIEEGLYLSPFIAFAKRSRCFPFPCDFRWSLLLSS